MTGLIRLHQNMQSHKLHMISAVFSGRLCTFMLNMSNVNQQLHTAQVGLTFVYPGGSGQRQVLSNSLRIILLISVSHPIPRRINLHFARYPSLI